MYNLCIHIIHALHLKKMVCVIVQYRQMCTCRSESLKLQMRKMPKKFLENIPSQIRLGSSFTLTLCLFKDFRSVPKISNFFFLLYSRDFNNFVSRSFGDFSRLLFSKPVSVTQLSGMPPWIKLSCYNSVSLCFCSFISEDLLNMSQKPKHKC